MKFNVFDLLKFG